MRPNHSRWEAIHFHTAFPDTDLSISSLPRVSIVLVCLFYDVSTNFQIVRCLLPRNAVLWSLERNEVTKKRFSKRPVPEDSIFRSSPRSRPRPTYPNNSSIFLTIPLPSPGTYGFNTPTSNPLTVSANPSTVDATAHPPTSSLSANSL